VRFARTALGAGIVEGDTFTPLSGDMFGAWRRTGEPLPLPAPAAPLEPASIRDFVTFEEHVEGIAGEVAP
jgi:Domain of unknown function (DUF2437)